MMRCLVLTMALILLYPALAVELRSGGNVNIGSGERITDDLVISGGSVDMQGTVTEDLVVATGNARINGPVGGDLLIAAGNITILQPVGGSVYIAGGNISIAAPVGRNVVVTGGTLRIEQGATIGRDLAISGGNVTLAGTVNRDVKASVGELNLTGTARVARNLYVVGAQPNIAAGAVVGGQTVVSQPHARRQARWMGVLGWVLFRLLWTIGLFLLGIVFMAIAPRLTEESVTTMRVHPWASLLTGLIVLIVAPIAFVILLVTVIGIPLALVLFFLYLAALILSPIVPAIWLGRLVLRNRQGSRYWALLIGLALLFLIRLIPVLGGLVGFIVLLLGLGALFLAWQGRSARPIYPTEPPPSAT